MRVFILSPRKKKGTSAPTVVDTVVDCTCFAVLGGGKNPRKERTRIRARTRLVAVIVRFFVYRAKINYLE